jgi:hypothetical protein
MVTPTALPSLPDPGLIPMDAGGLIMSVEVFELAKAVPPSVVPATETKYVCGVAGAKAAGILKVKRRVVPTKVTIEIGGMFATGPALPGAGCKVTVTLASVMVPLGTPNPVTPTVPIVACPAVGAVLAARVMAMVSVMVVLPVPVSSANCAVANPAERKDRIRNAVHLAVLDKTVFIGKIPGTAFLIDQDTLLVKLASFAKNWNDQQKQPAQHQR